MKNKKQIVAKILELQELMVNKSGPVFRGGLIREAIALNIIAHKIAILFWAIGEEKIWVKAYGNALVPDFVKNKKPLTIIKDELTDWLSEKKS